MSTQFKAAFDHIKADEALIHKTQLFLQEHLNDTVPDTNSGQPAAPAVITVQGWTQSRRKHARHAPASGLGASRPGPFSVLQSWPQTRPIVAVLIAFILFIGGGAGAYTYYQTPAYYLCVDINPSVELGINRFGLVVNARAFNDDGQVIIQELDLTNHKVSTAVQILVGSAIEHGYIDQDGSSVLCFTSESNDRETGARLESQATDGAIAAMDSSGQELQIIQAWVPLGLHDEALRLGIAPGKLNLIRQLQKVKPQASIDQYRESSIREIVMEIKYSYDPGIILDENTPGNISGLDDIDIDNDALEKADNNNGDGYHDHDAPGTPGSHEKESENDSDLDEDKDDSSNSNPHGNPHQDDVDTHNESQKPGNEIEGQDNQTQDGHNSGKPDENESNPESGTEHGKPDTNNNNWSSDESSDNNGDLHGNSSYNNEHDQDNDESPSHPSRQDEDGDGNDVNSLERRAQNHLNRSGNERQGSQG